MSGVSSFIEVTVSSGIPSVPSRSCSIPGTQWALLFMRAGIPWAALIPHGGCMHSSRRPTDTCKNSRLLYWAVHGSQPAFLHILYKLSRLHDCWCPGSYDINSLRPRQNGRLFADDTFKRIFLNDNIRISTKTSLKFVPKGLINNIPALVLIMAWRRPGDKPLSEPMLVRSLTHICVTWPQWVKPSAVYILYKLSRLHDYWCPGSHGIKPSAVCILYKLGW